MNIIVLICDALRATNLGCYGYDKNTSPEIDEISKTGALFTNAFSAINTTDPSFTSLFTGRYPTSHGVLHHANKINEVEKSYTKNLTFLPEILHKKDFVTIGVDWLGKWHKRGYDFYGGVKNNPCIYNQTGTTTSDKEKKLTLSRIYRAASKKMFSKLSLSFGVYNWYYLISSSSRKRIRSLLQSYHLKSAKSLLKLRENPILSDSSALSDLAIKYIHEFAGKKNFFLFVHFWDNHIPYTAPKSIVRDFLSNYDYPSEKVLPILKKLSGTKAKRLILSTLRGRTPDTIGEIIANYDASIKYVDSNIGRIYKSLQETNILNDSLLVISSDHGESLTEHDIFFDHHGLYDPQLRIPLIICHPDIQAGNSYDELVQNFDIMPTILDIAGIHDVKISTDGDSLLKIIKNKTWGRDFVFSEETNAQRKRMIRDKNYKFIKALNRSKCTYCQKYHSEYDEFYDLQNDPEEKENISQQERSSMYENELNRFINSLSKPQEGKSVKFEDETEINKRLEALGYM